VLRARRLVLIGHPLQHTVVDEMAQALPEDVARDPEPALEVIETADAEEGVTDDEQAPPLAHHRQAVRHPAVHVLEAGAAHDHHDSWLHDRTQSPSLSLP